MVFKHDKHTYHTRIARVDDCFVVERSVTLLGTLLEILPEMPFEILQRYLQILVDVYQTMALE